MKLDAQMAAIVTGGASGLGAATARALAERGVKVAIFDLDGERGRATADEIGGIFCEVNVTIDESVAAGFAAARAAHGQERVLVNCAGVGYAVKTIARAKTDATIKPHPIDVFERTISVNLIGTFRCVTVSAQGMVELDPLDDGERGAIITTASVAAEDGQIGQAAYSASKGGVVSMTLPIARDLMSEGIRVNTILPGTFGTPMLLSMGQHVVDALSATVPFPKRLGHPEEYAQMVLALIENVYVNAAQVRLDGGIRMAPR